MSFRLLFTILFILIICSPLKAQSFDYYGGSKQVTDSIKTLLESLKEPTFMNRGNYFRARQEFGKDSEQAKKMLQKMIPDDSLNSLKVIAIYNNYGWPKETQIK